MAGSGTLKPAEHAPDNAVMWLLMAGTGAMVIIQSKLFSPTRLGMARGRGGEEG